MANREQYAINASFSNDHGDGRRCIDVGPPKQYLGHLRQWAVHRHVVKPITIEVANDTLCSDGAAPHHVDGNELIATKNYDRAWGSHNEHVVHTVAVDVSG